MGFKYNYPDHVRAAKRRALTLAKLASAEGTSLIGLKAATLTARPVGPSHAMGFKYNYSDHVRAAKRRALTPAKLASAEGTS